MNTPNSPLASYGAQMSFQSSTANAWSASFLRHLKVELDRISLADHRQLMERVCSAAQAMFNARYPALPDVPSYTVLAMCALILSAYRELVVQLGSPARAFDVTKRAFDQAYQAFIKNICKPLLLGSNHSLQTLANMNFRTWSDRMYKKDDARGGAQAVTLGSDISGYHHFFLEQDEPGLAQIIQHADQAWIEAVAAYGQPQHMERRWPRSCDADFSPFHFAPNAKKNTQARPDVVLELEVNVPAGRR